MTAMKGNTASVSPYFYPGDICATRATGFTGWLMRKLFRPWTDRWHFFLIISDYIAWDEDYVILESTGCKGVTVGRLSWYRAQNIEVYRLNHPDWQDIGRQAAIAMTRYGRRGYDYLLPLKLLLSAVRLVLKGRFPPWEAPQLEYVRNARLICTEAVCEAYRMTGYPLVPESVCPLPSELERALRNGKLMLAVIPYYE